MASEFEYTPQPAQGVTLGTSSLEEAAADPYRNPKLRQQQQQQNSETTTAQTTGRQSGGSQRPVTMSERDVGAVTADGQVVQNPNHLPDPKRQDAFDARARAGARQQAELSRQQYYDGIKANDSLQNDQFKRGVDEVNQRGFNLYGVLDDIDKTKGDTISPEQARMLDAATTDFGKQVATNYGWNFNGAEYDQDKGTFTFEFTNANGQVGTKTMSREALQKQMIAAGYVDDPVEVRKREMAEEAERQKTDLATAKFAADLGFKQDELAQKLAVAKQENVVKLIEVASKLRGEDGQLDDFGKAILSYAINGLTGVQDGQNVQQGESAHGYNGAAAQFADSGSGATFANNSDGLSGEVKQRISQQAEAARTQNEWRKNEDAKIRAAKDAKRAEQSAANEASVESQSSIVKFGSGVGGVDKETSKELADLRRQKGNGTLTQGGLARLKELEGGELTAEERATMKKTGYGDEAKAERRSVARDMTRRNMGVDGQQGAESEERAPGAPRKGGAVEALVNRIKEKHAKGAALNDEEKKTLAMYGGVGDGGAGDVETEGVSGDDEAARAEEQTAAYEARGDEYRSQFADGPNDEQRRMEEEDAKAEREANERKDYDDMAKSAAEEERVNARLDEMLRSRGMRMKDLDEKQIKSISTFIGRDNEDAANELLNRAEQGMADELVRRRETSERLNRQIKGDVRSAEMTKGDAKLAVELKGDIAENYSDVLSNAGLVNEDLTSDDYRRMAAAKRYAEEHALPGKAEEAGRMAVEDYLYDLGERGPAKEADPRKRLKRENAKRASDEKRSAFDRKQRMDEANEAAARANRTMGASTFGGTVYDTVKDVGYGLRKSGKAIAGAARAIHNAGERAGEEIYTWREASEDAKKEREERRAKRKNRKGN